MPVILFDQLGGSPGTTGTWSYIGVPTPFPTAPVTYNGAVDFTGFAAGDYVYLYTIKDTNDVCTHTAEVTVQVEVGIAPAGDTCTTPISFNIINTPGQTYSLNDQSMLGECPDLPATLSSAVATPASWVGTFGADLWFRAIITLPAPWTVTFLVTSAAVSSPLLNPYLAVYDACSVVSLIAEEVPFNQNTVNITIEDTDTVGGEVFIRVGALSGSEGNFNINAITSFGL